MRKESVDICFVLPSLNSGGMENYLLRFLQWAGFGKRASVVVKSGRKGDLLDEYRAMGANIEFRGISYTNPRRWYQFYRFLRNNCFCTICDLTGNFAGMSLFLARLAGIPKRIAFYRRSSHAFQPNRARLIYAWLMNRLVYANSTAILSNSQHSLDVFFGSRTKRGHKFRIISNGIDSGRFNTSLSKGEARSNLGLPADSFIVGHVGRFDPAKNHLAIFETGRLLKQRIPSLRLLFCGGGTDSDAFRRAMAPYNIDDVVVALGTRNDVEVVFRALDVFYFPSITEGQPNALLEAMLCGLPILASNIDPIADIIPEAYRGNLLIDAHATGEAAERIYAHYAGECNSVSLIEYASITFDLTRNFELLYNEL